MQKQTIKYILVLALVLFASVAIAGVTVIVVGGSAGGVADHCDDTSDADEGCEGLETNPGYDIGACGAAPCWTETAGNGTITEDTAVDGGIAYDCTDNGSLELLVTMTDHDTATYAEWNNGAGITDFWVQAYITLTAEALGDTNNTDFFKISTNVDGGNYRIECSFRQENGPIYKVRCDNWDGGTYDTYTSTNTFTVDNQFRFRAKWDQTNDACSVFLDATAIYEKSGGDCGTGNIQYMLFGGTAGDDGYTMRVDNIKMDNDTAPGACTS